MDIILILLYVFINVYTIVRYYKVVLGVFQAPFLASCACLGVFLPQLTTIYFSSYYDHKLLYNLLYVMITCNLAFSIGFEIGNKKRLPYILRDLDLKESKLMFVVLTGIGFLASYSLRGVWMNELEGSSRSNFILMVNLTNFLELSFIYALVFLTKFKVRDKIIITIIVLAAMLYLESIFLLGRRNLSLKLSLNLLLCFSLFYPKFNRYSRAIVLIIFLFGSILSGSIGDVRSNLHSDNGTSSISSKIEFLENFKNSFFQKDFSIGMDLGNAALGIDYCYKNNDYDYGLHLWNGFVFNFVPKFLVGESFKNSLMVKFEYNNMVPQLTHSITTMTGYFDAFASFSYLAFLKFLLTGYIFGLCWRRSYTSSLYLMIYMFLFTQATSNFTHNSQYVFMRIEFFGIFCLPFIAYYIYKKRRVMGAKILIEAKLK